MFLCVGLPLLVGAVASTAIAIAGDFPCRAAGFRSWQVAVAVAWKFAADVAVPSLMPEGPAPRGRKSPMRHAAKTKPSTQDSEPGQYAIAPDGPQAKRRAALPTGMPAIRTAKSLVR